MSYRYSVSGPKDLFVEGLKYDEVIDRLISAYDAFHCTVTQWDMSRIEADGEPLITEQLNGNEWLFKYC